MKRIALAAACLLLIQHAFSQGIVFSKENSLQNSLKKASAGKKLLFISLHSDACGPCREMDNTIFNQKEAGARFNTAFVNIKLNTASADGSALLKKYAAEATGGAYLFLNGKGELVYRFLLPVSLQELLENANRASVASFNNKPVGQWMVEYADKKTDRSFLREYLAQLARLQLSASAEYDQYLSLLSPAEKLADSTIKLILLNRSPLDIHSVTFKLLWDRYSKLSADLQSKSRLEWVVANSVRTGSQAIFQSGKKEELAFLVQLSKSAPESGLCESSWYYEEEFYRVNHLYKEYLESVVPAIEKHAQELIAKKYTGGNAAQKATDVIIKVVPFLAMNYTGPAVLARAEALAARGVELDPIDFPVRFQVWQFYAGILYKQGKKDLAIQKMRKAIGLILADDPRFNYKKQCESELAKMESGQKIW